MVVLVAKDIRVPVMGLSCWYRNPFSIVIYYVNMSYLNSIYMSKGLSFFILLSEADYGEMRGSKESGGAHKYQRQFLLSLKSNPSAHFACILCKP